MQGANSQQVKRLEEAVEKLEARNRELLEAFQVSRDEAAAGRQGTAHEGEELAKVREQLARARQRGAELEAELVSERTALARLRNAERTVVDLTTGMSVEAKRQIEELQRRLNVQERQNQQLKRTLTQEEAGGAADGGSGSGGGSDAGGGRRPGSSGASR